MLSITEFASIERYAGQVEDDLAGAEAPGALAAAAGRPS